MNWKRFQVINLAVYKETGLKESNAMSEFSPEAHKQSFLCMPHKKRWCHVGNRTKIANILVFAAFNYYWVTWVLISWIMWYGVCGKQCQCWRGLRGTPRWRRISLRAVQWRKYIWTRWPPVKYLCWSFLPARWLPVRLCLLSIRPSCMYIWIPGLTVDA